jgi:murein tripeptide amidase MpaA
MTRRAWFWALALSLIVDQASAMAQTYEYYPGATYDSNVPTLKQVVGHDWGEQITMHHEMERYLQTLVQASPKVRLVRYGETWEGRSLYYLIITSEANMTRLDQIKVGLQRLADPRTVSESETERLIQTLLPVTWLAYGVHGNEISSPDAALLLAYHLVAAQNDEMVRQILDRTVVIIDPMQNPDGRDRFINYFRQTRGRWPDEDQQAAEHNETWPSGRTNHYLFDMNRDWFANTQLETRGRTKAVLEWFPVVFVDLHEMGSNSTYYFAPPAPPYNPNLTPAQVEWLKTYGQNNAEWFDRFRFDYFTREVFDSFYPGYGEGWPMFHGAIGMTYEQASVRGLVVKRDDETVMHYRDSIQHHFIASLSTAQTTARQREALLRYFYNYRRSAVQEGQQEPVKEFIIASGSDPNRTTKLAALLMAQGVEVKRADAPFTNARVRDYYEDKPQAKEFPAGTYVVSLAQPAKRMAKALMEKHTPMNDEFIKEQIRRRQKRLPDEIYDVTGWSLPLLYDVECYMAEQSSQGRFTMLKEAPTPQGKVHGEKAHLAYLIPWGTNSAARALADLLRQGVRVFSADKALTLNNVKFPAGSLIVKVKDNPENLHERMVKLSAEHGVNIYPTDRAWIEEGINLGSSEVQYLKPPKIAMAWHQPTSSLSAGWTRYLLEQMYGLPVTIIHAQQLGSADLNKYTVLILPNGSSSGYSQMLGEAGAKRIKDWVQQGGTLVTFGEATRWLTDEKVDLLSTTRELKGGKPEAEKKEEKPQTPKSGEEKKAETTAAAPPKDQYNVEQAIQPEKELPDATPGAIMRVQLDTEHWLGFGYDGDANVVVESRNIFTPLKLDKGRNIGLYMPEDKVLLSGFTWEESRKQLGSKAYLMYQPQGRGHVVAFAEDPNYRAFCDGLNLLFLNGIFFGPGH